MAGLTREGFTPLSFAEVRSRIGSRLTAFQSTIDLSPESPDGQLVDIFSFEISQAWSELNAVYNSYNPDEAVGAGLRNIGFISGLPYGAATRSQVVVNLTGTSGTPVPAGSIVADDKGNQFATSFAATVPASVQVVALVSGPINVDIGTITTVVTPVTGWTGVTQTVAGRVGSAPQTETEYRNLRNKTVLRNHVSVEEAIRARLLETLGIEQVVVLNNDSSTNTLPDGTPPNTIHVTVGEVPAGITDADIASVILATKGLGCPTYGTTTTNVDDAQGNPHDVSFSKATAATVWMDIEVLFLDEDFAGSADLIIKDLVTEINGLATDQDVIWSRLFGVITPYSRAQVNKLELSSDGVNFAPSNLAIGANQFANTVAGNINLVVVN